MLLRRRPIRARSSSVAPALWLALLPALAGCHAAPDGQVAARVNGADITNRDIATELTAAGPDAMLTPIMVLDKLVDRQVVVAEAQRLGIDKTPDYLALTRRASNVILGQQLLAKWGRDVPAPDDAAIADYIAANPQMFASRQALLLDQIVLAPHGIRSDDLLKLPTIDAVAAALDQAHIRYARGRQVVDSANLPRAYFEKLTTVRAGEPIIQAGDDALRIVALLQANPAPQPSEAERRDAAIAAMRQKAVMAKIAELRAGSNIERRALALGGEPSGAKP